MNHELNRELCQLVKDYEQPLLRYATGILRNPETARDVVQDAFVKYVRQRQADAAPIANARAWLYRVAHNLCLDHIRKFSRVDALDEDHERVLADEGQGAPDVRLERREAIHLAWKALEILSERDRQVVILKVMDDKSYKEIAEIMELSVTNVGFILHASMKKLAAALNQSTS